MHVLFFVIVVFKLQLQRRQPMKLCPVAGVSERDARARVHEPFVRNGAAQAEHLEAQFLLGRRPTRR
ncbi:hypothetical protein MRX96_031489 [Rhipicephalus microplus]